MTMDGEHVGRQSDSLNDDDGYRRSAAARLANVAKPSGKTFRKTSDYHDLGDGDQCPAVDADGQSLQHGRMYVFSGRQYCPHQSHDMGVPRDGTRPERKDQDA